MNKKVRVLLRILLIYISYTIIPNYYCRHFSKNIVKKLSCQGKCIALTFDDGPDEKYTEKLLKVLKENDVKATFFIVAKHAEKNKTILKFMREEGHTLAMHSLSHKSAWLSFPWETVFDFKKSLEIFNKLNLKMKYYRPPWGTFNAVSLYCAKKYRLKVILWTVEAHDWKKENTPDHIEAILKQKITPNQIILLHDSGGSKGAPLNTIDALSRLIPKLKALGYQFVTIEEAGL